MPMTPKPSAKARQKSFAQHMAAFQDTHEGFIRGLVRDVRSLPCKPEQQNKGRGK